ASVDAQRYFEQAAGLVREPLARAQLHERAGEMAWIGNRGAESAAHLENALQLYESEHASHPAARVAALLGQVDWYRGQQEVALTRMQQAFAALRDEPPDADFAQLTERLGWFYTLKGDVATGNAHVESALEVAEALELPSVMVDALIDKEFILEAWNRPEEGLALLKHALDMALKHELSSQASRALGNPAEAHRIRDRYREAIDYDRRGLALSRKVGNSRWEVLCNAEMTY